MYDYTGWIVQATAGRDQGDLFCVVGVDQEQQRLLLADGKRRKAQKPKRKKLRHVRFEPWRIDPALFGDNAADAHLRKALRALEGKQDTESEEG